MRDKKSVWRANYCDESSVQPWRFGWSRMRKNLPHNLYRLGRGSYGFSRAQALRPGPRVFRICWATLTRIQCYSLRGFHTDLKYDPRFSLLERHIWSSERVFEWSGANHMRRYWMFDQSSPFSREGKLMTSVHTVDWEFWETSLILTRLLLWLLDRWLDCVVIKPNFVHLLPNLMLISKWSHDPQWTACFFFAEKVDHIHALWG